MSTARSATPLADKWESRVGPSPQPVPPMSPEQEAGLGPLALDIAERAKVRFPLDLGFLSMSPNGWFAR